MADNLNITPEMIQNLVGMLKNDNGSNTESADSTVKTNSNGFGDGIDFDTILKLKSVMEAFNNNDNPDANLLNSLKPYLRKSRREKLDQYANLLKISKIANLFNKSSH